MPLRRISSRIATWSCADGITASWMGASFCTAKASQNALVKRIVVDTFALRCCHAPAMNEFDVYAPPENSTNVSQVSGDRSESVKYALERLNEHLRDPEKAQGDLDQSGPRFRRMTLGLIGGGVLSGLIVKLVGEGLILRRDQMQATSLLFFASAFAIMGVYFLIADLRFARRENLTSPVATLRNYLESLRTDRPGRGWSLLCPTAREQTVAAPNLGPIPVPSDSHDLFSPDVFAQYATMFVYRPRSLFDETKATRSFRVTECNLMRDDGDVAKVEATVKFRWMPLWAEVAPALGAVAMMTLQQSLWFIIGLVIYGLAWLFIGKTHVATFCKTLIRGSNGLWYIHSGDLLQDEAPMPPPEPAKKAPRKRS